MKSKWLFLSIAVISLLLSFLLEFISDEVKAKAKSLFGNHYDVAWVLIFLLFGALFIYLSWRQFKSEKDNSSRDSTVQTVQTGIEEKKGANLVVEELDAKKGIDFKYDVPIESSDRFKKLKTEEGRIKIDVKKKK